MHSLCCSDKVWVNNITLRQVICGSRIMNSSIVDLYATVTTAKTLTMQLKLSRYTGDDERSAHAVLRNRVKPAKHPERKGFFQSMRTCNQSREVHSFCDFDWKNDTHRGQESELVRNPRILGAE